eukprot:13942291-Alexandrium_andersonii.AAC.1
MSASLVGSEMCIRDRARRSWASGAWPRAQPPTSAFAAFGTVAGRAGSVSYTHLTLPTICSV